MLRGGLLAVIASPLASLGEKLSIQASATRLPHRWAAVIPVWVILSQPGP
jgi:hypothetical protein